MLNMYIQTEFYFPSIFRIIALLGFHIDRQGLQPPPLKQFGLIVLKRCLNFFFVLKNKFKNKNCSQQRKTKQSL